MQQTTRPAEDLCPPGIRLNGASTYRAADVSYCNPSRPLLTQHDRAALIVANDVECVLTDIDAEDGNGSWDGLGHGVLLVVGTPCQLLTGQ